MRTSLMIAPMVTVLAEEKPEGTSVTVWADGQLQLFFLVEALMTPAGLNVNLHLIGGDLQLEFWRPVTNRLACVLWATWRPAYEDEDHTYETIEVEWSGVMRHHSDGHWWNELRNEEEWRKEKRRLLNLKVAELHKFYAPAK